MSDEKVVDFMEKKKESDEGRTLGVKVKEVIKSSDKLGKGKGNAGQTS